jgi:tRNA U34 2-thiouridine synthase MnmA/TrmU
MDCHALMFSLAGEMMKERGFDFLFSGEVMGQRPMSQTKSSLRYVEKHSGFDGYILRPLSAQRLPETLPEKEGLVRRDLLLGISGRSRKPQIELAEKFGITDYPAPAGGCLLTDKGFSERLKDLFRHQTSYSENDLHLLKYGRHLRTDPDTKIIVGRTRQDNENISRYYNPAADTLIKTKEIPGPLVLMPRSGSRETVLLAASICVGYSKVPENTEAEVMITRSETRESVRVKGMPKDEVSRLLIPQRL